jgi:hypothetical protein
MLNQFGAPLQPLQQDPRASTTFVERVSPRDGGASGFIPALSVVAMFVVIAIMFLIIPQTQFFTDLYPVSTTVDAVVTSSPRVGG